MVASPAATPVITPLLSTVATDFLLLLYVGFSVPLPGFTVVVNVAFFPFFTVTLVGLTEMDGFLTVILQVLLIPFAFAVMVASPFATAVTFPFSTFAMDVSEDFHVTFAPATSVPFSVATSVIVLTPFV